MERPCSNLNVAAITCFAIATLLLLASSGCCQLQSATVPLAEKFENVKELMTQAEVTALLGAPVAKRSTTFPEGQFMGPAEGMIGIIVPGQSYEEWEYTVGCEVFLIFFAGENIDDPQNQWNVVGKTQYPAGAVF